VSSDFVMLGHEAKIRINDRPFAVVGGDLEFSSQEHDTSDTEGNGYEDGRGGLKILRVNIEAQHASDVNPWASPLGIGPNSTIDLKIYPNGLDDLGSVYHCPKFLCLGGTHGFAVRAPQALRLRGRSKGSFTVPGEAAL
jgi:hypothetical protein